MIGTIKKIILFTPPLRFLYRLIYNNYISRKYESNIGTNAFIGIRSILEGRNAIGENSSLVNSKIGYGSYISKNSHFSKTIIGRYTSIGPNVSCVFGKHPSHTFVSTHPVFFAPETEVGFSFTQSLKFKEYSNKINPNESYTIEIKNDVWIGSNVLIMDGITIGNGSIVAAGSVVVKDVEPYSVVGGVPAKLIKHRFKKEQIKFLEKFKWWDKDRDWIEKNAKLFENIEGFMNKYNSNVS